MSELVGNLLVAQSGGPTVVINGSLAGIILEAGKHECIEEVYGGRNGILGILNEDLLDLNEEKRKTIEGLKFTPAAALGTCRYKINFADKPEQAGRDMDRLFEVFQAHNIRFFLYIGGNDSQDTAHKIHQEAGKRGWEMRVIGIPKTIDNDLPHTDHCPGYGSVIKYNASVVLEVAVDIASMATDDGACCVIEVMGRAAGWIAAGTVLARRGPDDAPHLILLPEVAFDEAAFLARVKEVTARVGFCIVVVAEGLKGADGKEMAADDSQRDSFGHANLSGVGDLLAKLIDAKTGFKSRSIRLGYAQRAAAHLGSAQDALEAAACGEAGVRAAANNESGCMVKLVRTQEKPYRWGTGLQPLGDIANVERAIPADWINAAEFSVNEKFLDYARPLIEGEIKVPMEGGVPKYVTLDKVPVEKKLAPRA